MQKTSHSKKRILYCGEFTQLPTGYGVYGHELLKRLHATGKYEIAEFATYGTEMDERQFNLPWKYYPNEPGNKNSSEYQEYKKHQINQFGCWRFESVCLDFKPDVVFSLRDPWMDEYIQTSPFRKFYRRVWMPTVDAEPQTPQWIGTRS